MHQSNHQAVFKLDVIWHIIKGSPNLLLYISNLLSHMTVKNFYISKERKSNNKNFCSSTEIKKRRNCNSNLIVTQCV